MADMMRFTGSKFVSGDWENGFGIQFSQNEAGEFTAKYIFAEHQQGPPTIAHGGAIATVLDEAMTAVAFQIADEPAFTVNLNITYRAPIFLGTEVTILAKLQEVAGRKITISAQITLPDSTITTEALGLFIKLSRTQ